MSDRPWRFIAAGDLILIWNGDRHVGRVRDLGDARRIVAAMNAVENIPTEALEELPANAEGFVSNLIAGKRKGH